MGFQKNTTDTERILTGSYRKCYHLTYGYIRNEDNALDVAQESAYRAVRDYDKVRNRNYLSTWVYKIVVNTALDLLRKKKKETLTKELPEIPVEDQYQEAELRTILNQLDHKNKSIIILGYFEDLKLEDITNILDDNLNTAKARLYRSLKKLGPNLEAEHYKDVADKFQKRVMLTKQDEKKQMGMLKQEYDHIPVLREAKTRMQTGIAQAKKEQRGAIIMRSARHTGRTVAAAMLIVTLLANLNPATTNAMEQIPVIESIAKIVAFRTSEDKKGNFGVDIQVPQITLESNGETQVPVNKSTKEYANELIADYEEELATNNSEGHYGVDSRYKVVTDTDKYLSIRINTTLTTAGGTQFIKIFTADKTAGNVMTPVELLKDKPAALETVSDQVKQQIEAQIAADENITYFYHSEMPEEDLKGLIGDESYHFNQSGELVITFDEYDVAPGYMGAVEFTIPASVIGAFQDPTSFLSRGCTADSLYIHFFILEKTHIFPPYPPY